MKTNHVQKLKELVHEAHEIMDERKDQTERAYRNMMTKKLLELLEIMEPQEQIYYGGLLYPELVSYASSRLRKEVAQVCKPATKPKPLSL